MVHTVADKADLDKQLDDAGDKLVVIDFYATWCGPCKAIAPFLEELTGKYDDVVFLKVDVDENEDIAGEYNVTKIPTFVFLKNKARMDTFCGTEQNKLQEMIEKHK